MVVICTHGDLTRELNTLVEFLMNVSTSNKTLIFEWLFHHSCKYECYMPEVCQIIMVCELYRVNHRSEEEIIF